MNTIDAMTPATTTPATNNFVAINKVLQQLTDAQKPGVQRGYYALPKADGTDEFWHVVDTVCRYQPAPAGSRTRKYTRATPEESATVIATLTAMNEADQAISRRLFGRSTCKCSNCGRKLRDTTSLDLGIGPVCRRRLDKAKAISNQLELGLVM